MEIENILDVVTEFTKRLQLPESAYDFIVTSGNENVELVILNGEDVKISVNITNGNIKVLYTDDYTADKYVAMEFRTLIELLYQLCIIFYSNVIEIVQIDFNKLLSIILMEDVYDWKTLLYALAENLNLMAEIRDDYVVIEGTEIRYSAYLNRINLAGNEINLSDGKYTTLVEALFKCVEYIAVLMEVEDNLFQVQEEEIIEEEPDNVAEEGGGDMDIDVDMEMPLEEGGEEPAPVEPMENETFKEPQGAVVTMDDLL